MKYIIAESNLKEIIKKVFNVDLTGKIHMITNKWELPTEFDGFFNDKLFRHYLNRFGPMYVIEVGNELYLAQNRVENDWEIYDTVDSGISEHELLDKIGVFSFRLSDLINLYVDEN